MMLAETVLPPTEIYVVPAVVAYFGRIEVEPSSPTGKEKDDEEEEEARRKDRRAGSLKC